MKRTSKKHEQIRAEEVSFPGLRACVFRGLDDLLTEATRQTPKLITKEIEMKRLPTNELILASKMVLWFAKGGGETGIDSVAILCAVPFNDITAWAIEEGYLWDDDQTISLSVMPFAWEYFANKSRVCQALHEARLVLEVEYEMIAEWIKECESDPCLRLRTPREKHDNSPLA